MAEKRELQKSEEAEKADKATNPSGGLGKSKEGTKIKAAEQPVPKSPITPAFSQASTSTEYPDLRAGDRGDDDGRRRDKKAATEVMGLRWAPLRVPFKRRLQTLAVLAHCLGIALALATFFLLCAVPFFWPISKFSLRIIHGYCVLYILYGPLTNVAQSSFMLLRPCSPQTASTATSRSERNGFGDFRSGSILSNISP